jgi:AsmA protein
VKLTLAGSVAVDAAKQTVAVQPDTRFDDTQLAAKIDVAGFDKPRIGFDLDADRLNVDRYLPQATADSAPRRAEAATNDVQFDFGFLRELNLAGQARVGQLQAFNIKSSTVRVGLKAASGRLDVAPLTAQLYGGTVNATASAQAAGNRVGLNADLAGVAIQPLLNDAAGTDLLEGRGNVKLAVNTAGTSVEAMKRALGGSGSLRLTDGAIRGINLAQKIRDARNLLAAGRSETQTSDASQKTDFSEISASFAIKDGVASSSDLDGRSPLLRLAGAGSADIGASRLDYTLRVSVVETTRGQSGPEIDALRGLTIPVHLSGPFDQPSWKIDWGTVAQQALKSRAGEELKKQLAPQTERLKEERDKLRDQLRGGLKGLLQR